MSNALKEYYTSDPNIVEAGLDECGYGSLAGPVVGAIVIWPKEPVYLADDHERYLYSKINDSKLVSPSLRAQLAPFIMAKCVDWSVSMQSNDVIDTVNVLQARNIAFRECISRMLVPPDLLLIDGTTWDREWTGAKSVLVPGGDRQYMSIAAASIVGKFLHDQYMAEIDTEYAGKYGWSSNMGYGADTHIQALHTFGLSKYHRKTYGICREIHLKNSLRDDLLNEPKN